MTPTVTLDRELAIALADHLRDKIFLGIMHGRVPVPDDAATLLRRLTDAIRQNSDMPKEMP